MFSFNLFCKNKLGVTKKTVGVLRTPLFRSEIKIGRDVASAKSTGSRMYMTVLALSSHWSDCVIYVCFDCLLLSLWNGSVPAKVRTPPSNVFSTKPGTQHL